MPENYILTGKYDFAVWSNKFDKTISNIYEKLHEELLYTNEKQHFVRAKEVFKIGQIKINFCKNAFKRPGWCFKHKKVHSQYHVQKKCS